LRDIMKKHEKIGEVTWNDVEELYSKKYNIPTHILRKCLVSQVIINEIIEQAEFLMQDDNVPGEFKALVDKIREN
jgi:hypothetical protein